MVGHTDACGTRILVNGKALTGNDEFRSHSSTARGWRIWPGSFRWMIPSNMVNNAHTHRHTQPHECTCACMHIHTRVQSLESSYQYRTNTHAHTGTQRHTNTHARAPRAHTHTHTYVYPPHVFSRNAQNLAPRFLLLCWCMHLPACVICDVWAGMYVASTS